MENLFLQIFIFIACTFILVKSSDYFIINAEKIGLSLKWPHFLTGVLIVALGTSLPELATSVASVMKDKTDMVVGNVFGSNIANIFLALGFMFFIVNKTVKFKHNVFDVHFPVLIMAMALAVLTAWDRVISPIEAFFFLGVLGSYLWFLFSEDHEHLHIPHVAPKFSWNYVVGCVAGLVGLIFSAKFLIDAIILVAVYFNLAETALSATLVAVGTSLPEMMVVYSALKRNNSELVIGNIIGSNIFNILIILGITGMMAPIVVSELSWNIIIPFAVAATLVYWMISIDRKITKQEGLAMTFLYILFLGKLFGYF